MILTILKNPGGSCASFAGGVGAAIIATAINPAIASNKPEPMIATIAIAVTPAERFISGTKVLFRIGRLVTIVQRPIVYATGICNQCEATYLLPIMSYNTFPGQINFSKVGR